MDPAPDSSVNEETKPDAAIEALRSEFGAKIEALQKEQEKLIADRDAAIAKKEEEIKRLRSTVVEQTTVNPTPVQPQKTEEELYLERLHADVDRCKEMLRSNILG